MCVFSLWFKCNALKIRSSRALLQKIIVVFFKFLMKSSFFTMWILMFLPPNANPLGCVRHSPTSLPLQNCEDSFFARAYLKCLRHLPAKMLQKFQFPSKNILEKFIVFKTLLISWVLRDTSANKNNKFNGGWNLESY